MFMMMKYTCLLKLPPWSWKGLPFLRIFPADIQSEIKFNFYFSKYSFICICQDSHFCIYTYLAHILRTDFGNTFLEIAVVT